jgi:flagellar assembly protein FliH
MKIRKGDSFNLLNEKVSPAFQTMHLLKKAQFHPIPFSRESIEKEQTLSADRSPGQQFKDEDEKKKEEEMKELQNRAQQIIIEAKREAEGIKDRAYQEGFIRGQKEGQKEIQTRLMSLAETFHHLIEQLEYTQSAILKEQETEILHLCIQMAQKIIHTEIQQNPRIILANLQEGLKSAGQHKIVAIKLNQIDLDLIQGMEEDLSQSILNLKGITLEGDPSLGRGGCLIQTDLGYADASIDAQFQELKKHLEAVP